jgi:multisubunit Na+/H+ antiporter MnhB subunit
MSLDMRLMFGYHISMMVMIVAGSSLTMRQELTIAATIAAIIVLISRYHRQKRHWRWPGVKPLDVLYAVGGAVLIAFFLYSATPLFPPNNSHVLPWYLAGLGIGVLGILQALKVVYGSEAEFASNCKIVDQYGRELDPIREPAFPVEPKEPKWKRIVKVIYTVVFLVTWIGGVASFYFFGTAFKNGSPEPTISQTESLENHGKIVYITPAEKQRVHALQLVSWIGTPLVLVGAAILHFLLGVKLIPNTPTLAEYLNRGKNTPSEPSV